MRSAVFLSIVLIGTYTPSGEDAHERRMSSPQEFVIGFVGILTYPTDSYHLIAVVQAFLYDYQKNFDHALIERFGPPLIAYPNLNSSLRVRVVVAEAENDELIAMERAIDFLTGRNGMPKVHALVMEGRDSVMVPVARMTSGAQLLTAGGSADWALSNKGKYPYYFRIGLITASYADVFWQYFKTFSFRSCIFYYSKETFGEAMFSITSDLFASDGRADSLEPVGVQATYNEQNLENAMGSIKQLKTKLVTIAAMRDCTGYMHSALFDAGIRGPTYQIFGFFTSLLDFAGFIRLGGPHMSAHGIYTFASPNAANIGMWKMLKNLTANDIDAQSLALDLWSSSANFRPHLLGAALTPEVFNHAEGRWNDVWASQAYAVFASLALVTQAANVMMNDGISIDDMLGEQLLNAARKIDTFEAPGMKIELDRNQDWYVRFYILRFTPQADLFAMWMPLPGGVATSGMLITVPSNPKYPNVSWNDGSESPLPPLTLRGCQAGQYLEESTGQCILCSRGTYTSTIEQTSCQACPSTLIVNAENSGCDKCPNGTLAVPGPSGDLVCQRCPPGQYVPAILQDGNRSDRGPQECLACSWGKFADGHGDSSEKCTDCPRGTTTAIVGAKSMRECVCEAGTFHHCQGDQCNAGVADPSAAGFCEACPLGATCKGPPESPKAMISNSGGHRPPFVPSCFMSVGTSVFKCGADGKACPGAFMFSPVGEMCAAEGIGIACATCPKGRYWKSNACEKCGTGTLLVVLFFVALILGSGVFIFHWNNKARKLDALESVLASVSIGVCVSFMQSLGVFSRMDYNWPAESEFVFDFVNLFLFDLGLLQVGCVFTDTLAVRSVTSLAMPLVIVMVFFLWYPLSYGISKLVPSFRAFRMDAVINATGMVFQAFFISMVLSVAKAFDCYASPNGELTLRSSPTDICWTGKHIPLVVGSSFAGLVYVVGFFALLAWVIIRAPVMVVNRSFRIRYRFVFFKYSPSTWYFGLVLMLRSVLISMVTIVSPNDGYMQFLLMLFLLVFFGFCHLSFLPYASLHANRLEIGLFTFLILILGLGSWFLADENGRSNADDYPDRADQLSTAILVSLVLCITMACLVFLQAFIEAANPAKVREKLRTKLEPMIQNIRAVGLILQAIDNEHLMQLLQHATYRDIDCFVNVVDYVTVEVAGVQPCSKFRARLPRVASEMKAAEGDGIDDLVKSAAKLGCGDQDELKDFVKCNSNASGVKGKLSIPSVGAEVPQSKLITSQEEFTFEVRNTRELMWL